MLNGFEIKCKKCGNIAVDIKETVVNYSQVRIKFKCLVSGCGYESEVPVTQTSFVNFEEQPKIEEIIMADIISDIKKHKERHVLLHECLDELLADFMKHTEKLPSKTPISDLMKWSYEETKNPTEG